jgi:hypothetical protein
MNAQLILNRDQQDEISNALGMLNAVQQLMIPHKDLSLVDRGEMSCLLSYFSDRLLNEADEDEKSALHCCLSAVIDLTIPEEDLHGVNRDNLCFLLGYLLNLLDKGFNGGSDERAID